MEKHLQEASGKDLDAEARSALLDVIVEDLKYVAFERKEDQARYANVLRCLEQMDITKQALDAKMVEKQWHLLLLRLQQFLQRHRDFLQHVTVDSAWMQQYIREEYELYETCLTAFGLTRLLFEHKLDEWHKAQAPA